jgi:hypothetical protein
LTVPRREGLGAQLPSNCNGQGPRGLKPAPEPKFRYKSRGRGSTSSAGLSGRSGFSQRLLEGWAYDEIARAERLSAERIRQIVSEVLGKRVIDRGEDHAHLQLERLMPALRLAGEAIARGNLKAIAPLVEVIDRLDKHQVTIVSKYVYGPEERERLLDKINRIAANLEAGKAQSQLSSLAGATERDSAESPS